MAIIQVRAQVNGIWYALTYDAAQRCYVAEIPAGETSADQPGGWYNVTVEASNDAGNTASIDGESLSSLRLVVKDLTAPTVTLISPPQGYLTTAAPSIIADLTDESSGVDITTLAVTIDGKPESSVTTEAITGGYRATILPTLADGLHTVDIAVNDQDGNTGTLELLYTVDTVPPELVVWDHRLVVDDAEVLIQGMAKDAAGAAVTASAGGWTGETAPDADGAWRLSVPLAVGVNEITVTATDGAGLVTSWTGMVIRMITDRVQADLDALRSILGRLNAGTASAADWETINQPQRGAYNASDLNRVGEAVQLLTASLNGQGYGLTTSPKTDWTEADIPTETPMETYLQDVSEIFGARLVQAQYVTLPESMASLTLAGANNIEWALVCVDEMTPVVKKSYIYSGEAFCSEF